MPAATGWRIQPARYNLEYRITGEQLDALVVHVRELRDRTEQACQERIALLAERADG